MIQKKAQLGNQTMIFAWIILLIIIAGSIVAGVYLFFGAAYDFSSIDAKILNSRVSECLEDHPPGPEFLELCNLNPKSINNTFLIVINDQQYGKGDLTQCALSEKNKAFPICITTTKTINSQTYKITTGSNQEIRREIA